MKSADRIPEVKELLQESGRQVMAVENCGMAGEAVYCSADEIPEDAGYFTIVIA
jgi:precorrin-2/cobalt-factor-2 C20-methyltransferase